jgi:acyl-CoA synthetase (AMP-forming)/AMP-acid ligase II
VSLPSSTTSPLRAGDRAPAPRTLVDVFAATVARHPDVPAIDDGDEVLTYSALADAVAVRAARLAAVGVGPGDRVGVRAASGTVDLYVSVLRTGCSPTPGSSPSSGTGRTRCCRTAARCRRPAGTCHRGLPGRRTTPG